MFLLFSFYAALTRSSYHRWVWTEKTNWQMLCLVFGGKAEFPHDNRSDFFGRKSLTIWLITRIHSGQWINQRTSQSFGEPAINLRSFPLSSSRREPQRLCGGEQPAAGCSSVSLRGNWVSLSDGTAPPCHPSGRPAAAHQPDENIWQLRL